MMSLRDARNSMRREVKRCDRYRALMIHYGYQAKLSLSDQNWYLQQLEERKHRAYLQYQAVFNRIQAKRKKP